MARVVVDEFVKILKTIFKVGYMVRTGKRGMIGIIGMVGWLQGAWIFVLIAGETLVVKYFTPRPVARGWPLVRVGAIVWIWALARFGSIASDGTLAIARIAIIVVIRVVAVVIIVNIVIVPVMDLVLIICI